MNYVASGPVVLLTATAWFLAWVLAFQGAGSAVVGRAVDRSELGGVLFHKTLSIALGAFLFSVWTFACGALGLLSMPALIVFFTAGLVLMVFDKRKHFADELRFTFEAWREAVFSTRLLLGALFVLAVLSLIAAQAPETGNDSLWYHLYLPRTFVEQGRLFYEPNHPRSLWPSMMGMLFSAGLVFQGVALAKLFSWLMMALGIAAVPSAVLYFTRDKVAAKYSAVFMGFIPALWMQSLYAYTDTAMMLYAFLAFTSLWICKQSGFGAREAAVAGFMLAALISIKFFTLIPAALMILMFAAAYIFTPASSGKKIKALCIIAGTIVIFSGSWFLRSYMLTGNPVFPFAAKWFGGHGFAQRMVGYVPVGTGKSAGDIAAILWKTAMDVDMFGGEPIGCLFAAALPAVLLFNRLRGFAAAAGMFAVVFIAAWFFSIQHIRFFFPALPFLAFVFAALGSEALREGTFLKKPLVVGFAALAALQFTLCVYYPARVLKGALGIEPAGEFLRKHERSFAFMEMAHSAAGADGGVLLLGEPRLFYSPSRSIYLNPGVRYAYQRDGLTFNQWFKKTGILYIGACSRGENERPPQDFLAPGEAFTAPLVKVGALTTRTDDGLYSCALWKTDEQP